jgi:ferritin heavy chain
LQQQGLFILNKEISNKMSTNNVSIVRQNFHDECEGALNRQVNMELCASYAYQSMAFYFDRDDIALPGFSKFFKHNSDEEREHAEKFMTYLNKRGGRVVLNHVPKPEKEQWGNLISNSRLN